MKKLSFAVAFFALLISCQTKPLTNQSSTNIDSSTITPIDKDSIASNNSFQYDSLLPPLDSCFCQEAYRFILWRSMHYTKVSKDLVSSGEIVITAIKASGRFKLDYFIYDHKYEKSDTNSLNPIPTALKHKLKPISESDWIELKALINESSFWTLNAKEENNIVDGSTWSFDGYIMSNKTHSIRRRSPSKQSKIFKLGELFVRLADEDIGELR